MNTNKIRQLALQSFSVELKEEFEIYLSGFEAGFKAALNEKKLQNVTLKQVEINGLLWDTENLTVNGKTHFTWDEALKAATSQGKRLPTKEEFEALLALDWRWSETDKGIWLTGDKLFFPASGYRHFSVGKHGGSGSGGYGWTSSPSGSNAWYLYFCSGYAYMNHSYRGYGFPVRCVQDMKTTQFPVTRKAEDETR